MTRFGRAVWWLTVAGLAGCGAPEPAVTGSGAEPVPIDSALASLVADLALADARASTVSEARRAGVRDSLRGVALAARGVSDAEARERLARLVRDPATARATYDAAERLLSAEPR